MMTSREELLVEQVNARIAQIRRSDRWWWLAGWRDWVEGALVGGASAAVPLGMYFWLSSPGRNEIALSVIVPLAVALFVGTTITAAGAHRRSREQRETIARLEERIRVLEEARDR